MLVIKVLACYCWKCTDHAAAQAVVWMLRAIAVVLILYIDTCIDAYNWGKTSGNHIHNIDKYTLPIIQ